MDGESRIAQRELEKTGYKTLVGHRFADLRIPIGSCATKHIPITSAAMSTAKISRTAPALN